MVQTPRNLVFSPGILEEADWVDIFFDGVAAINKNRESLDQKKAQIASEHNQIVDELEVLIDSVESKRQSQTVRKEKGTGRDRDTRKPNPLLVNPGNPGNPLMNPLLVNPNPLMNNSLMNPGKAIPSIEQFIRNQGVAAGAANLSRGYMNSDRSFSDHSFHSVGANKTGDPDLDSQLKRMESLYMRCQSLEQSFDKLIDETDAIYRKERSDLRDFVVKNATESSLHKSLRLIQFLRALFVAQQTQHREERHFQTVICDMFVEIPHTKIKLESAISR